ncbi:MAG TPA: hypothetical protein DD435_00335 [Cyanobacteria bacterium UBA8530]|nr:hypothetical protein [Cyanobacteria bacterium UBA8530]
MTLASSGYSNKWGGAQAEMVFGGLVRNERRFESGLWRALEQAFPGLSAVFGRYEISPLRASDGLLLRFMTACKPYDDAI